MRFSPTKPLYSALAIALSCAAALSAHANLLDCGVNLGAAGPGPYTYTDGNPLHTVAHANGWAAFTLGDMIDKDDLSGSSIIKGGDVGVGGGPGTADLNMSGSSVIEKDLWQHTGGAFTTYNRTMSLHGAWYQDTLHDRLIDQAATDALNADNAAWNLGQTANSYPGITTISTGSNYTLMANSTCTVLSLQDFKLSGGTFTLQGTAAQHFIINVKNNFSLSGSAKVVLNGGVTWDNVLWNIHGGGPDASLTGSSSLTGIVLAAKRKFTIAGATLNGEIIANKLVMSGPAKIDRPPVTSN